MPKWGLVEWFVVSQTLLPALLFIPGISAVRPVLRISAYAVGLLVMALVAHSGRRAKVEDRFPARYWLYFCAGWLVLSVFHPNTYSLMTAVSHVSLYIAVMSPAFFASKVIQSPRQLSRVIAVLFLCNALSAAVGVAQVYRPTIFNPPVIPALANGYNGADLSYEGADGRLILRPCGLTDTPGHAAGPGSIAAVIGLCLALRPIGLLRRGACLALSFIGMAAIYYTQVRLTLIMTVVGIVVVTIIFTLRGNVRQAAMLAFGGAGTLAAALAYVVGKAGKSALNRFATLVADDPTSFFAKNRGGFVRHALEVVLPDNPLGFGLGWWGMTHGLFRDPSRISPVWVEVMIAAWVFDGGVPLIVGYGGAVLVALYDTGRIALTTRDPDLGFWAAVALALNIGIAASAFSFVTFLSPMGLTFWLLAGLVHAADRQVQAGISSAGPAMPPGARLRPDAKPKPRHGGGPMPPFAPRGAGA